MVKGSVHRKQNLKHFIQNHLPCVSRIVKKIDTNLFSHDSLVKLIFHMWKFRKEIKVGAENYASSIKIRLELHKTGVQCVHLPGIVVAYAWT